MSEAVSKIKTTLVGSKRMLIVFGLITLVVGFIYYFGSGGPVVHKSEVRTNIDMNKTVQGQKAVSSEYGNQLTKSDIDRASAANKTGGTSMPTIRVEDTTQAVMGREEKKTDSDLDKLPRPMPPQIDRPALTITPVNSQVVSPIRVAENETVTPLKLPDFGKGGYVGAAVTFYSKNQTPSSTAKATDKQVQTASGDFNLNGQIGGIRLPLPGTIVYAEMIGEANSDAPGPVLAKLLQGDLAGTTLIGTFTTMKESLVLKFTTLTMGTSPNGDEVNKTVGVSAVAVDTKTISTGLATDVDHHFLSNVALGAAASFAQGFGQAIGQSGTTTVISGTGTVTSTSSDKTLSQQLWQAGGTAAGNAGQSLNQLYGNRPITIKIAAGTPIGVLFLPSNGQ